MYRDEKRNEPRPIPKKLRYQKNLDILKIGYTKKPFLGHLSLLCLLPVARVKFGFGPVPSFQLCTYLEEISTAYR